MFITGMDPLQSILLLEFSLQAGSYHACSEG